MSTSSLPDTDNFLNLLDNTLTDTWAKPQNDIDGIGDIAIKIVDSIAPKSPYAEIFFNWVAIVGDEYSTIATPYKIISGTSSARTLVLECKRGFALEIQHESEKILGLINNFFGEKFFTSLKVIQVDHFHSIHK